MSNRTSAFAWVLALLLASCAWLYAPGNAQVPGATVKDGQMRQAAGEWMPLDTAVLANWPGPYELRWQLKLAQDEQSLGLRLALRGAAELYCNGQLVLRSGQPGRHAAEEVPGSIDRWLALPPLAAGTHELRLLGSSHHVRMGQFANPHIGVQPLPLEAIPRQRFARWAVVGLACGGLTLAWLYFLHLEQRPGTHPRPGARAHRWSLIGLGTVGLVLPVIESARDLWSYPYPWHAVRMQIILVSTLIAACLLPASLALQWGWPRRVAPWLAAWAGGLVLMVAIALPMGGYDVTSWCLHLAGLSAALALAWQARRQTNAPEVHTNRALMALLAVAYAWLWFDPAAFLDGLYTITLAMIMMFLMLDHARQQQELALAEAEQRQALQAQLLRTSMQPHGLMNTLAVLQELIEQRPANASRLVERLADQFNLLRALSQKPLVSLREELELARTQLDLVEMAREMSLPLSVEGPLDEVRLPPGVLHTLVENAITHGGVLKDAPAFSLRVTSGADQRWTIELRSPRGAGREGGGGQGQRFVRESLANAFGADGSFESRPLDERTWLDRFSIPQR